METLIVLLVLIILPVLCEHPLDVYRNYHEIIGIPLAKKIKNDDSTEFSDRIFNGHPSTLGANPYLGGLIIRLRSNSISICGSALISDKRLVSAAHCCKDTRNEAHKFLVVLGATAIFRNGIRIAATSVDVHAEYDAWNLANDIAMISIIPIQFSRNIQPIALPINFVNNDLIGWWATTAGYGAYGDNVDIDFNQIENEENLQIVPISVCQVFFGDTIPASIICGKASRSNTCRGDSGGPLAIRSRNQIVLIGITSFGYTHGCSKGYPVGFTRVTSYLPWIQARL